VPSRTGQERDVEAIREAVEGLGRNGMEHLDALDAVMGPLSRAIERQRQEAQQVA
jgi:hypothetical protein